MTDDRLKEIELDYPDSTENIYDYVPELIAEVRRLSKAMGCHTLKNECPNCHLIIEVKAHSVVALRKENERLRAENERLRDEHTGLCADLAAKADEITDLRDKNEKLRLLWLDAIEMCRSTEADKQAFVARIDTALRSEK